MKGHVLLSHGLDSGPQASKVTALAKVAEELGFRTTRPDYRDLDATKDVNRIDERITRLKQSIVAGEDLILAGSSMGGFISGLASLDLPCVGLFLIAPPITIPGYRRPFAAARIPTMLVHGWNDELTPPGEVIDFAQARNDTLVLVNDSHRLSNHVEFIAEQFKQFISKLI